MVEEEVLMEEVVMGELVEEEQLPGSSSAHFETLMVSSYKTILLVHFHVLWG